MEVAEYDEIYVSVDQNVMLVSLGVAFVGAYLTTSITEQLRLSYTLGGIYQLTSAMFWYVLMGVAVGGICLWVTHTLGLYSMAFYEADTDREIPVEYAVGSLLGSLILIVFTSILGMVVSSHDSMYLRSRLEIVAHFLPGANNLAAKELARMERKHLPWIICTKDLKYLVAGGTINGVGLVLMHIVGMQSIQFPGHFHALGGALFGWIVLVLAMSIVVYWMIFRLLSLFPATESLRIFCALFMGVGSYGLHVLGMMSFHVKYSPNHDGIGIKPVLTTDVQYALYPTIIVVLVVITFMIVTLLSDLRKITHRQLIKTRATNLDKRNIKTVELLGQLTRFLSLSNISVFSSSAASVHFESSPSPPGSHHQHHHHVHAALPHLSGHLPLTTDTLRVQPTIPEEVGDDSVAPSNNPHRYIHRDASFDDKEAQRGAGAGERHIHFADDESSSDGVAHVKVMHENLESSQSSRSH